MKGTVRICDSSLADFEQNAVDPATNTSVHISGMEELLKLRRTHQRQPAEYLHKLIEW